MPRKHAKGMPPGNRSLTILFHPDYTVGPGVAPDLLTQGSVAKALALAGYTAGGEFRPALRIPGEIARQLCLAGSAAWASLWRGLAAHRGCALMHR